jgi:hypothetical protein
VLCRRFIVTEGEVKIHPVTSAFGRKLPQPWCDSDWYNYTDIGEVLQGLDGFGNGLAEGGVPGRYRRVIGVRGWTSGKSTPPHWNGGEK